MVNHERLPEDYEDAATDHFVDRPHDVLAGWIVAILILLAAALVIGPDRFLDGDAQVPANPSLESVSGTGDILMDDHTFAPDAIAVHPSDRLVFHNVGRDLQALTLAGHEDILQEALVEPGASFTFVIPPNLGTGARLLTCTTHDKMSLRLVVTIGPEVEPDENAPGALLGGANGSGPVVAEGSQRDRAAQAPSIPSNEISP